MNLSLHLSCEIELTFNIKLNFYFRSEASVESIGKQLAKEQGVLRELHMKSQQFKQALAQHAQPK